MPIALSGREPRVTPEQMLQGLHVPPAFDRASFDTYRPDPAEPTQAIALERARGFAAGLNAAPSTRRFWQRPRPASDTAAGLYLDGGFGVGKTHLLASVWRACEGAKAYATFVELTHLVGALGFAEAVERLAAYQLLCIDEFELDDPGDTVLVSTLLARLVRRGVHVAATSNTLPDALGAGRFAADDFQREIQALAGHFDVVRIDGPDFRHRDAASPAAPRAEGELVSLAGATPDASLDHFVDLTRHLAQVHPSRYGALVDGVRLACLTDVRPLTDQATALRLVVLVDRLYDHNVAVVASGVPWAELFSAEMLAGGYRKKYFRALSRLSELSHLA